jgi:hypothetical protein
VLLLCVSCREVLRRFEGGSAEVGVGGWEALARCMNCLC